MGHHSKGKDKASKRLPDSSSKVQKLLDQVAQEQARYDQYYNEYADNAQRATAYQEQLDVEQGQLAQLSDSSDAAQRARGYVGDPEMGPEQEGYRRHNRRADFERSITTLQDSIQHYNRKAERASKKCSEKQKEIADLQAKLQSLAANPTFDTDKWFIPGTDRHPDFDEDGPTGSVSWAGAGPAN